MNLTKRIGVAVSAFLKDDQLSLPIDEYKNPIIINKEEVLSNGKSLTDKKDVEDPTGKFARVKIVKSTINNNRLRSGVDFFKPEYDLPTIANAIQLDGILRRAVNIFTEQIMKNGFECVSTNDKIQTHIQKRIKEISLLTGFSLYEILTQVANQLVSYGNAYIIKVRSEVQTKIGKPYILYGKQVNPIVGLFIAEATTMEIGLNATGNVVQYKQRIRGDETFYDERDVIHLTYNRIPGTLTGMSSILPILDDVRALRKLEEEIEILGFQYSIPLYLYKVGTKDQPPAPGEIEEVSATVNSMPAYGMLVVPGHHTIEVPSNSNTPVDILSFVEHFKKRIFSGLGVSPVAMGETSSSNRNTSEVSDVSMQSVTKAYQQILKTKLEIGFLNELLLDGKFNTLNDETEFNFPEIDLEQQIKFETNVIAKWQNDLISLEEARNEMDYDKILESARTHSQLVELPKIQAKGDVDAQVAKAKASISNKVAPANQKGKSSGRPKYVKNSIDIVTMDINNLFVSLMDSTGISDFNLCNLQDKISNTFRIKATQQIKDNISKLKQEFNIENVTIDQVLIDSYINDVVTILKDKTKFYSKKVNVSGGTRIFYNELNDFLQTQILKTDNLSKILTYKSLGFKTILINDSLCDQHKMRNLSINNLNYYQIPPFNYGCSCSIDDESLYEFNT